MIPAAVLSYAVRSSTNWYRPGVLDVERVRNRRRLVIRERQWAFALLLLVAGAARTEALAGDLRLRDDSRDHRHDLRDNRLRGGEVLLQQQAVTG